MGVASCGKTSVGEMLAERLGAVFTEGDRLHPKANVEKMSAGIPLTDDDRWPWLGAVGEALQGDGGRIASCSALKKAYREHIAAKAGRPVAFVFLDGSRELLERRIAARKGHFMPPSLLASQLATLERPGPDERARAFDIARPVEEIAAEAGAWLLQEFA
ncbi:gluconokinase [Aestuariivirga sp.]|uniref:gluconokinase n=1 Tax=Aestuariivirga sp. TaxID=2650926 RepID=UPI0035938A26